VRKHQISALAGTVGSKLSDNPAATISVAIDHRGIA
jgi:hypothetical protein